MGKWETVKQNISGSAALGFVVIIFLTTSCSEEIQSNDIRESRSAEHVVWLDELIDIRAEQYPDQFYVEKGLYNLQDIYLIKFCCPTCEEKTEVFDATGNLVSIHSKNTEIATENSPLKLNDVLFRGIYWQPGHLDCFNLE